MAADRCWSAVLMFALGSGFASAAPTGVSPAAQSLSVRQGGMGDVSAGSGDLLNAWTNPATLAALPYASVYALGGGRLLGGSEEAFSLGIGLAAGELGSLGAFLTTTMADMAEIDAAGDSTGARIGESYQAAKVAFASDAGQHLRFGGALGGGTDTVLGDRVSWLAADAGLEADWDAWGLGASVRSLPVASASADLPIEGRLGVSWQPGRRSIYLAAEHVISRDRTPNDRLGVEWRVVPMLAVRGGLDGLDDNQRNATVGLSLSWRQFVLDWGLQFHAAGSSQVLALSYQRERQRLSAASTRVDASPGVPGPFEAPAAHPAPTATEPPVAGPPAAPESVLRPSVASASPFGTTMAVADLQALEPVSASDAANASDWLREALISQGAFTIVERAQMRSILAEQGLQQTGCTQQDCIVKLGRLLNVRRMVVGTFGKFGASYTMNLRIVEVETGKAVYADHAAGKDQEDLSQAVRDLAVRIAHALNP